MPILLILLLTLLIMGTVVAYFLSWHRPTYAGNAAAIVVIVAAGMWLLVGRSLPLSSSPAGFALEGHFPAWTFLIDENVWQLSFYLLLLVISTLSVAVTQKKLFSRRGEDSLRTRWFAPTVLLMTLGVLVTIWADSLTGFMTGWILFTIFWLALLWITDSVKEDAGALVKRGGILLLSLMFLGIAAVTAGTTGQLTLTDSDWTNQARNWAAMAVLVQLGVFPLHWWRRLRISDPSPAAALIQISPAVVGGILLARLSQFGQDWDPGVLLVLTAVGLLGMLIGAGFAWIHLTSSGHVALAAIMVQISIVLLAGMWTSGWAVVAETRILILATGGLALIHHRAERRFVWVKALFIAAFAGLPLTAGFGSRVGLYKSWLDDGRGLLVLVMALLHVSVIAALLRPFWLDGNVSDHKSETSLEKIRLGAGLGIGMVGLLSFARTPLGDVSILTWGAILLPVIFGVIISWQAERVREAHLGLRRALHFELPMTRINRLWANAFSIFKDILRESTATLEGEGGMLWLLLLLVVFWLARSA